MWGNPALNITTWIAHTSCRFVVIGICVSSERSQTCRVVIGGVKKAWLDKTPVYLGLYTNSPPWIGIWTSILCAPFTPQHQRGTWTWPVARANPMYHFSSDFVICFFGWVAELKIFYGPGSGTTIIKHQTWLWEDLGTTRLESEWMDSPKNCTPNVQPQQAQIPKQRGPRPTG